MTEPCYERWFTTTNYDKVLMKQTKKSVLTVLQVRNWLSKQNTLLTRSCLFLTFNSTRPPPVTVYPLQVKFESIIISNAQNAGFYTDYLARNRPVCFIGQELACFFYWPGTGLFLLLARNRPISFIGQELANAFALSLLHSLFLARNRPMLLCLHYINLF